MTSRVAVLILALAFSATSCSPPAGEVSIPPASESSATAGFETVAIRESVVEFLEAYALSRESMESLGRTVQGPELRDWVHWVGVQNRHLPEATGRLDVQAIRVLQLQDPVALAAVDATVSFTFVNEEGQEEQGIPRTFQSPVILTRRPGSMSWAVADVVRDGRSMIESITVLNPPVTARHAGLAVELVSVYRFSSGTVVNLTFRNTGSRPVRIDRERSVLQVDGQTLQPEASTASLAEPIPAGGSLQAAFNFSGVPLTAVPEGLLLRLRGENEPISLRLPAEPFTPSEET